MKGIPLEGILFLALVLFNYPAVSAEDGSVLELEEIIVTARKKEENIQDTALSVSALSEADIADRFAADIRDLAADSPSLLIDDLQQGPGSPTAIFIRGIGVSDVEKNEINQLIMKRNEYREQKNFEQADRIRDQITKKNIIFVSI